MNRKELERYIVETYNSEVEAPWVKYPDNTIFRHNDNQKWFAAQTENGLAYGEKFAAFMERKFPNLRPKISFSMPMWWGGKKMNEGFVGYSAAKGHFSIHFSDEDFVTRLGAELPSCKTGRRCINIKYGDEQTFEAVQEKAKEFLDALLSD